MASVAGARRAGAPSRGPAPCPRCRPAAAAPAAAAAAAAPAARRPHQHPPCRPSSSSSCRPPRAARAAAPTRPRRRTASGRLFWGGGWGVSGHHRPGRARGAVEWEAGVWGGVPQPGVSAPRITPRSQLGASRGYEDAGLLSHRVTSTRLWQCQRAWEKSGSACDTPCTGSSGGSGPG